MREIIDEYHIIGNPPFCDLAVEPFQQFALGDLRPGLQHHCQQRALLPFRMSHANDCRFGNRGMTDRGVF